MLPFLRLFTNDFRLYKFRKGLLSQALSLTRHIKIQFCNCSIYERDSYAFYKTRGFYPAADKSDTIIYDITDHKGASGFGHPACAGTENAIVQALPKVQAVAPAAQ
jgi:hypothetical protein